MGDIDYHQGNVGVITKEENGEIRYIATKIDHGRSLMNFHPNINTIFSDLSLKIQHYQYAKIDLDPLKLKESLEQMMQVSLEEIKSLIDARIYNLKKQGFDFKGLDIGYSEGMGWYGVGNHQISEAEEAKENFIQRLKDQRKIIQEFCKKLDIIAKITPKVENWLNTFIHRDPILFASQQGYKIEGKDPIAWAIENKLLISGQDPVSFAVARNLRINNERPLIWALKQNIKINGVHPAIYAIQYQNDFHPQYDFNHLLKNVEKESLKLTEKELDLCVQFHQKATTQSEKEFIATIHSQHYKNTNQSLINMNSSLGTVLGNKNDLENLLGNAEGKRLFEKVLQNKYLDLEVREEMEKAKKQYNDNSQHLDLSKKEIAGVAFMSIVGLGLGGKWLYDKLKESKEKKHESLVDRSLQNFKYVVAEVQEHNQHKSSYQSLAELMQQRDHIRDRTSIVNEEHKHSRDSSFTKLDSLHQSLEKAMEGNKKGYTSPIFIDSERSRGKAFIMDEEQRSETSSRSCHSR